MKLTVEQMDALCASARAALDPEQTPAMDRAELSRFLRESRKRDDALWARIQSDDRPQQRLALN